MEKNERRKSGNSRLRLCFCAESEPERGDDADDEALPKVRRVVCVGHPARAVVDDLFRPACEAEVVRRVGLGLFCRERDSLCGEVVVAFAGGRGAREAGGDGCDQAEGQCGMQRVQVGEQGRPDGD